jgi:ribosomal protein S27AE
MIDIKTEQEHKESCGGMFWAMAEHDNSTTYTCDKCGER